ncbi:hypothetical protein POM88_016865 [Heracleum sosnowskyi]|uniref:Uncharacterized protein n=1 Tax=Heracleum sosnowskyi TaxID=360622 RepID=A0AAD8IMT4_9APIA|nr:hypothetical protein POM88_016865 [Heracleum sosnowskyi]
MYFAHFQPKLQESVFSQKSEASTIIATKCEAFAIIPTILEAVKEDFHREFTAKVAVIGGAGSFTSLLWYDLSGQADKDRAEKESRRLKKIETMEKLKAENQKQAMVTRIELPKKRQWRRFKRRLRSIAYEKKAEKESHRLKKLEAMEKIKVENEKQHAEVMAAIALLKSVRVRFSDD